MRDASTQLSFLQERGYPVEFDWSPEIQAFRKEVREFIKTVLPAGWIGAGEDADWEFQQFARKKLAEQKWLVMHWPIEYGGLGYSHWHMVTYAEEMTYARYPGVYGIATNTAGPSIMVYGSEEQKRHLLPAIANADLYFCQMFTEPGAGSDLASLQTRAIREGDDYVVNGQKVFTGGAHHADKAWLAARTDVNAPKHRGISTFVLDMKTPGITIRPLIGMAGEHSGNEIFLDNVRVPVTDLVGTENRGWYQMATTLDFERSSITRWYGVKRTFDDIVTFVKEAGANGSTLAKQPRVRTKLADIHVQIEVARYIAYRIISMQNQGLIPNRETSVAKVFGPELVQRCFNAGMQILGLYGQIKPNGKYARLRGQIEHGYLSSISGTIAGGSSEINRNIIANRGLGLPR